MNSFAGVIRKSLYVGIGTVLLAHSALCNHGPRGASDYGGSPLATCGTNGPFSGVSATCYVGSGEYPDDFLFNFTLTGAPASTSVTSFTIDFGSGTGNGTGIPTDYGLVVGDGTSTPCADVVPCASQYTENDPPPFTVNGTVGSGLQTFDFTGFTADQSGQVTVDFEYANGAAGSIPVVTDITTSLTATTPEPGVLALFSVGGIFLLSVLIRRRARVS